jgi:von Willebrand factor
MSMKRSVYGCLGLLALGASAIALIVVSRSDLETIAAVEQTANDTTQLTAAEGTSIAAITSVSMSDQVVAVPSWQRLAAASDASLPAIGWTYERERYPSFEGNKTKLVREEPVSTFSIDVDTASYANVRRFLRAGNLPPPQRRSNRRAHQLLRLQLRQAGSPRGTLPGRSRAVPSAVGCQSAAAADRLTGLRDSKCGATAVQSRVSRRHVGLHE